MTQQVTTEEETTWLIKRPKNIPEDDTEKCGPTKLYEKFSTPYHSVSNKNGKKKKEKKGNSIMKILFYVVSFWAQERTMSEQIPPGDL